MDNLLSISLNVGPLLTSFILGFSVIVLLWWNSSRKQEYWKKIGIPYVKPIPFLGSIAQNIKKPLHESELERYRSNGRVYGHYEGNNPLLSVAEPELLRQILVKDFHAFTGRRIIQTGDRIFERMLQTLQGEDWKRVRTIVTPTFTTGKIRRMMSIFNECAQTLVQNFKKAAEKGEPIEAKSLYSAFTMDIIASSAFSTKIDSHNDPNNEFLRSARTVFGGRINWRFVLYTLSPGLMKFFKVPIFPQEGMKFFTKITLQIIEERKRTGATRNDFLQLLLDTSKGLSEDGKLDLDEKDDITENYGKEDDQMFKQSTYRKKTLSTEELIAQCVIFFLAGFETSASTLAFVSYCLALNPDVQEKLTREVDNARRESNGKLTYESIQNMKYLNNVISESMRLYPPAVRLERMADEDYKLGDTGLTIPKGMIVTVPVYAIHRDPEFYPDPEKFDPERFSAEERERRDQYAYIPFGAGPRNCIGMRFALMEVKVCLANVLSNFRIKKCPETKVPLEFHIGQGLLMTKGVKLVLELRKDTVQTTE